MGSDKALLNMRGTSMARLLATRLRELTDEVLLSANDPLTYNFLGLPTVPDLYPGCGPMAGLHAAMLRTNRPWILLLACDLPRVSTEMLNNIILRAPGFDAVIPATSDGRLHPVCAIYSRTCLPAIERGLRASDNRLIRLLEEPGLQIRQLTAAEGDFTDSDLLDLDTREDLEEFLRLSKF
jgi:molybdopterin-guanine dinucleotide biosynthesis protein A